MEYWSGGVLEFMGCWGAISTLQYSITPPLRRPPRANRRREFPCFQVITGPASVFAGEPLAEIRGIYRGTL
jgi:hypothetical protein